MANVVLGVTGGIAAYKSAPLIRQLSEAGHDVKVIVTKNALRFVGEVTLEALSKSKVQIVDPELFTDVDQVKHISLAKNADVVLIAPATASFIAKITAGIADDLLTSTVLATIAPVVIAPAMHTEMWESEATQANISKLKERGISIVEPGFGRLTGEDSGVGRLAEAEEIVAATYSKISGSLSGLKVLVTAGGTREQVDAVRFIGNHSSGKQGIAFAKTAQSLGASVRLIAANIESSLLKGLDHEDVTSASEMKLALDKEIGDFDVLVMAAAVSDFKPVKPVDGKIKKSEIPAVLTIELEKNPDLLVSITEKLKKNQDKATIIGFAAEATTDLAELAKKKLLEKGCDFIVANDISNGRVFGSDRNQILLVGQDFEKSFSGNKTEIASEVWSVVAARLGRK